MAAGNGFIYRVLDLMGIVCETGITNEEILVAQQYRQMVRVLGRFVVKDRFLKIDITTHEIATQYPEAVTALCRVQCDKIVELRKAAYVDEVTAYHLMNWRDGTTYPKGPGTAIMDDIDARYPYPGAYR